MPFFPLAHPKLFFRKTLGQKQEAKNGISPVSALLTALAGCVGVGNIVGVASAIAVGGAGAVFWMWMAAILTSMVKYAETFLAMRYRRPMEDGWVGGPMYYLEDGLKSKALAKLYAVLGFCSAIGVGTIVQTNTVSEVNAKAFGIPPAITAAALAFFLLFLFVGKSTKVFSLSGILCPAMVGVYLVCCAVILLLRRDALPDAFRLIFQEAFCPRSALGGGIWLSMKSGFSKSVFSNEAGVGTATLAHAKSNEKSPVVQGLWSIWEVILDTLVICSASALVVLSSAEHNIYSAFQSAFGELGNPLLAVILCAFALSTVAAWTFYGKEFAFYLWKDRGKPIFPLLFSAFSLVGCFMEIKQVWTLTEVFNALAMIPNLIAIVALSPQVGRALKLYVHDDG